MFESDQFRLKFLSHRHCVSWWRHQMETFSSLLAFCAGNSPVIGEFPAQRQVTRSFDVFFDLRWTNGSPNSREAGDLRRYRIHYDVTVMHRTEIPSTTISGMVFALRCMELSNIYIYIYICVCVCVFIHIYIYVYICPPILYQPTHVDGCGYSGAIWSSRLSAATILT